MSKRSSRNTLPRREQYIILEQLASLMKHGLTLQEGLFFLKTRYYKKVRMNEAVTNIYQQLSLGYPLYEAFSSVGFSPLIISELKLSQLHGNLCTTLSHLAHNLGEEESKWQQLWKLLTYPLCLLLMLFFLLFALKYMLLPQLGNLLDQMHPLSRFLISHFSFIIFMIFLLILCIIFFIQVHIQHYPPLAKVNFYMQFPFIRHYYQVIYTYMFAYEWGRLLQLGIDTQRILVEFQDDGHPLWLSQLSGELEEGLHRGESIVQQLQRYPFMTEGFIYFMMQGEVKGKLGEEMMFYANDLWKQWMITVDKLLTFVQPFIFIFIGIMIIFLYATILLPLYSSF